MIEKKTVPEEDIIISKIISIGGEYCKCQSYDCGCPIFRSKVGTLNHIISQVQSRVSCKKSGNNVFMGYKYSTYDEMMWALRPFIHKYKFSIHFSHEVIEKIDQDVVIQPPEGPPIPSKITRLFLETNMAVLWEDIRSPSKKTYIEITTTKKTGCDSSQSFNSLETGGKKRALSNFFCMVTKDETKNDPDNLVYYEDNEEEEQK